MEQTQLLLTEDDILEAKRMFDWRYWYETVLFMASTYAQSMRDFNSNRREANLVRIVFLPASRVARPCPRRRSCAGCGNGKPSAPQVGTEWTLAAMVRVSW